MSFQKFVTTFAGKKPVLLLTAAFFTLSSFIADRANFSGEWKLNDSKSELGRMGIFCLTDNIYAFKTMKIAGQADFLLVDVATSSADGALVRRQEKLSFDGKKSEASLFGSTTKKSTAKWSADGQTMTVNSVIYFDMNGEKTEIKVTEVWKLINDGKSILLQSNSNSAFGENAMKLVYDKAVSIPKRFHTSPT
jgi:hypothetical protein